MMMGLVFAGITLFAVLMATFVNHTRRAILSLWVAGLGVGAMYLTVGAEFLAIIQWIVSTLVTISFVFFAVMFGEYNPSEVKEVKKNDLLLTILSLILGSSFAAVIWLGAGALPEEPMILPVQKSDLGVVGRTLTQDHLLSLEVLALTLFLVLVGGGVVARSEGNDSC
jgi:NADH:ubiquinone oxidoreductase subunit 6 (subunit J)